MTWPIYVSERPDKRGNCKLSAFYSIDEIDPPRSNLRVDLFWWVRGTDRDGKRHSLCVLQEEADRITAILRNEAAQCSIEKAQTVKVRVEEV